MEQSELFRHLEQLAALKEKGILTQEEFEAQKAVLLSTSKDAPYAPVANASEGVAAVDDANAVGEGNQKNVIIRVLLGLGVAAIAFVALFGVDTVKSIFALGVGDHARVGGEVIKKSLQNPDSFRYVAGKTYWKGKDAKGNPAYVVLVSYTAQNAFGGTLSGCNLVSYSKAPDATLSWGPYGVHQVDDVMCSVMDAPETEKILSETAASFAKLNSFSNSDRVSIDSTTPSSPTQTPEASPSEEPSDLLKPDTSTFNASSLPATFDDNSWARFCHDASGKGFEFKENADEALKGKQVRLTLVANNYSIEKQMIDAAIESKMGPEVEKTEVVVHLSGASVPDGLKKGARFTVEGKIDSADLWGNVVDGCFLRVFATQVTLDGF